MKWIGLLFLSGAILLYCELLIRRAKHSLVIRKGVISLIEHIVEQTRTYSMPLDEIFHSFPFEIDNGRFDDLLKSEGLTVACKKGHTAEWPKDAWNELTSLSQFLGQVTAREQIDRCERCLTRLREARDADSTALPDRIKVYRTLGIALVLLITILLL